MAIPCTVMIICVSLLTAVCKINGQLVQPSLLKSHTCNVFPERGDNGLKVIEETYPKSPGVVQCGCPCLHPQYRGNRGRGTAVRERIPQNLQSKFYASHSYIMRTHLDSPTPPLPKSKCKGQPLLTFWCYWVPGSGGSKHPLYPSICPSVNRNTAHPIPLSQRYYNDAYLQRRVCLFCLVLKRKTQRCRD